MNTESKTFTAPTQQQAFNLLVSYEHAVSAHGEWARAASTAYLDCRGHELPELSSNAAGAKSRMEEMEATHPWIRAARNAGIDSNTAGRATYAEACRFTAVELGEAA